MIYLPREDSFLLEKEVKKYCSGKNILDIGSGSGILAKAALDSNAKTVLAIDINSESVKFIKKQGINAIVSDLFEKVIGKFDLIIFNPPYLPEDKNEDSESSLATTGGKKGDEIILRFLKKVDKYLSKDGKILILLSSLTPMKDIDNLIKKKKLKKIQLSSKNVFFETLYVFELSKG